MNAFLGFTDEADVPAGYDKYIWADNCCFDGIEWCKKNGKEYEILKEPNVKLSEINDTYLYLENVRKKIIEFATQILNKYQNSFYSEEKWSILLSPFLIFIIPSIYDKYQKIKIDLKKEEHLRTFLFNIKKLDIPLDYYDVMFLSYESGDYHRYLYSLMLPFIDRRHEIEVITSDYHRDMMKEYADELPEYIKSFLKKYGEYKDKIRMDDEVVIQSSLIKFSLYKKIIENRYGKISGYFHNYYVDVRNRLKTDVDYEWRTTPKAEISENDEFICLMYKLLPMILPLAYVEAFREIRKTAKDNYKWGMNPKVVVFDAMGTHSNEMFKTYLMGLEKNVKKIGIQHAGLYGFGGSFWGQIYELSQYNEFLGTGSDSDVFKNTHITQMPFINFFRMPNIKRHNVDKILFLNYTFPKNCLALTTRKCDYFIKKDMNFLERLNESLLNRIIIRSYPFLNLGYNVKEIIKKTVQKVKFDMNRDLYDSLADTCLLVSSGIGTSIIEALHTGIPVLIMHHPNVGYHAFSQKTDDIVLIKEMIEVGLISETPEKLAQTVNSVADCVEEWWNETKRQAVVKKFKEKYAYFPSDAEKLWIDKIASYAD